MSPNSLALCVFSLLLAVAQASAANHAVAVGGTQLVFTPASLTVNVGDTVTFTNAGGFHDVSSDTVGLFRCANGCDGSGGNGSPSSASWSATVTFNTPGTFGYHCEVHGLFGMTGSITVNPAVAPGPPISAPILSGPMYVLLATLLLLTAAVVRLRSSRSAVTLRRQD